MAPRSGAIGLANLRRDGLAQDFAKKTKRDETHNLRKPHSPRRQVQPMVSWSYVV